MLGRGRGVGGRGGGGGGAQSQANIYNMFYVSFTHFRKKK